MALALQNEINNLPAIVDAAHAKGMVIALNPSPCDAKLEAVETTAAGDTYTGYFIAGLMAGMPQKDCMRRASKASSISVTRLGAAGSIPSLSKVGE